MSTEHDEKKNYITENKLLLLGQETKIERNDV